MASSCSTETTIRSSSSEENVRLDDRKRKRMLSNRESARRSRMRKQKHLDDLTAQITQLTGENQQIVSTLNITTQLYMSIEAENCVLRAQLSELNNRLQSLNEIIQVVNHGINVGYDQNLMEGCGFDNRIISGGNDGDYDDLLMVMNPWGGSVYSNQPILASDHMIMY